jgi:pimeloyl-ACP methyl ester carboxylesterase
VQAPTLLIVGGDDEPVIELNEQAKRRMQAIARLEIIPGATHLFEEHGALEQVERLAADWFRQYLPRHSGRRGAVDMLDGVAPGEK